jgi:hypothetical protein
MLGEDYEEEFETNKKDIFKLKNNSNSNYNNNQNDYLEYSTNKSREGKKERSKKHKKKSSCDNCKALNQKINELEQLNEELLKIKEKLSQSNEELTLKNEELLQNNITIINKNKELLSINKQLKEDNEELINKNNELIEEKAGYKTEIIGLKKQLMSKINEINTLSKDKDIITNTGDEKNNDKQDNKNNILNVDMVSLNSDSIPPKKEDIISNSIKSNRFDTNINNIISDVKYCTMEDYNELKNIVEELKEKVNNLEKWKKTVNLGEKTRKKSKDKEKKNIFLDNDKSETSVKQVEKNINKKSKDNNEKLSKSLTIEQKIKNSFNEVNNTSSNSNNNNSFNFNLENNKNKKIEINSKINKSFSKIEKEKDNINSKKNKETEKTKPKNQRFNSKIITNVEDLDLIARGLVKDDIDSLKNLRVGYKLIYRSSDHGEEAEDFHERCDDIEGTLTIIKTKEGNIFGGYTSLSWDPEEEAEKKDDDAFVFSLNLEKLYFESGKKDYSIFCDKNKGPCFVGMFAIQENFIKNKSYINPWGIQCFSGENSNYEINKGKNDFFIEELEVFQVIVKRN